MLLAYRLVRLIETHSDGLARSLHERYCHDKRCSAYASVPDSELRAKVYEVYRHLGEWLLSKTEADVERRYLQIGAERAEHGVPASQLVWMICKSTPSWISLPRSLARWNCWNYSTSFSTAPSITRRSAMSAPRTAIKCFRSPQPFSKGAARNVVVRSVPQQTDHGPSGGAVCAVGDAGVHPPRVRGARGAGRSPDGPGGLRQER